MVLNRAIVGTIIIIQRSTWLQDRQTTSIDCLFLP